MIADLAPIAPVAEILHGIPVTDPYRWLEERDTPATAAWITDQQRRHDNYFADIPEITFLRNRVSEFLKLEAFDQPTQIGNRDFYRKRLAGQEQPSIYMRDVVTGADHELVNSEQQGPFASVAIHRISKDGSLLAYTLRRGGSDMTSIHIVDVEKRQILPDFLNTGYSRGFVFAPDRQGFYYCHEQSRSNSSHTIRFHYFGEAASEDRIMFSTPTANNSKLVLLENELQIVAVFSYSERNASFIDAYLSDHNFPRAWTPIFVHKQMPYALRPMYGSLYALTQEDAPNKTIIELNPDGTTHHIVVPEGPHEIRYFIIAGQYCFVSYLINCQTIIRKWSLSGDYAGDLRLPTDGSIELLPSFCNRTGSLFFSHESFAEPLRIYRYHASTNETVPVPMTDPVPLRKKLQLSEISYPSSDGTMIPISILRATDTDLDDMRPLILTGYGGFGVTMTPKFSILVTIMLELGAVFAVPKIRGGSEFGKSWHEAAIREHRQVAINDFLAAAEYLCARRITAPDKLAIFGGSNSGLLVGAAMTQRPELFRAVLCIAPLLDMVRYSKFDSARKWQNEYGNVDEAEDFHALYAYSPYHHVRQGQNYPSTLFVSGDKDDRCNPAHVRKMAALLQNRAAQRNPIIVDYELQRGHAPALPVSLRIDSLARRLAFLCRELGIDLPLEGYP